MNYHEFFSRALNKTLRSQIKLKDLLAIIASGIDLRALSIHFASYDDIIFDQTESILDAFPHFLEIVPNGVTTTISMSVESSLVKQIASIFGSVIPDTRVTTFSPMSAKDNIFICDNADLLATWARFVSFRKQSHESREIGLYWPRLAVLDSKNERFRRRMSSSLERLAYRAGLKNSWQYNRPRLPATLPDFFILTKAQSIGVGFESCLIINENPLGEHKTGDSSARNSTSTLILIHEENIAEVLSPRNRVNYRFYLSGREVFIRQVSLDGDAENWFVEVKSGPAELRISPFLLVAERI